MSIRVLIHLCFVASSQAWLRFHFLGDALPMHGAASVYHPEPGHSLFERILMIYRLRQIHELMDHDVLRRKLSPAVTHNDHQPIMDFSPTYNSVGHVYNFLELLFLLVVVFTVASAYVAYKSRDELTEIPTKVREPNAVELGSFVSYGAVDQRIADQDIV